MSSEGGGGLPRTWQEAIPYVVWVVLVLGFGLEFVSALVHAEWLRALVSFVGLVALMAAALHWNQIKSWTARSNPNWVIAILLLAFVYVAAPGVYQRATETAVPVPPVGTGAGTPVVDSTPPPVPANPPKPQPKFVDNIQVHFSNLESVSLTGTYAITADRLRISVAAGPSPGSQKRIFVNQKEPAKGEEMNIQLLQMADAKYWWGDPNNRDPLFGPAPGFPNVYVQLIFTGPANEEQHYYFLITWQDKTFPFVISSSTPRDWATEWEKETK
jgi:hypothetical protein